MTDSSSNPVSLTKLPVPESARPPTEQYYEGRGQGTAVSAYGGVIGVSNRAVRKTRMRGQKGRKK